MKNMSRGRKKNFSSAVTIQFTVDEKRMLDEIAARDRRSLAGEIVWLIESYHSGMLDDVQKTVMAVDRAIRAVVERGGNPFSVYRAAVVPKTETSDDKSQERTQDL